MPLRPIAHKFTITSTAEGSSTALGSDIADFGHFGHGFSAAMVQHKQTGSTKNIAFTMQGSIGQSGLWTDLSAATTGSTAAGGAAKNSTATATFDRLRLNVTANATTGNATLTCWVAVR